MTLSLDDVLGEFQQDSKLDEVLLDKSALSLPSLTAKYLDYQTQFKKQLRSFHRQKKAIPVTERRVSEDYARLEELISQQEDAIEATTEMLRAINQMSYSVGNAVKWRMFINGTDTL